MSALLAHVEYIPLVVNSLMTVAFVQRREWGKALYWSGATILTIGLIKMRG